MSTLIRSIANILLNATVLCVLYYRTQRDQAWFQNNIRSLVISLIVTLVIGIVTYFPYKRPIKLSVTQTNQQTGAGFTQYVRNESGQALRTINVTIKALRRPSWNAFLRRYLKNRPIYVELRCNPPGLELQPIDYLLMPNELTITDDNEGFRIDITNYVKSISLHRNTASPEKTYPYFIRETKEANNVVNGDITCYVNPVLLTSNGEPAGRILSFLLGWRPEQHEIVYKHRGG